ncbi:MAG TPA: S9 family peptidase [Bryobacteraceae bacterium]|nr:S9 family peptidase [Bryobacteraceae bacterium]
MKIGFCAFVLIAGVAWGQKAVTPVEPALAEIANTHWFPQAVVSPDGSHVAYVASLAGGKSGITVAAVENSNSSVHITAGDGKAACDEEAIAWSPDSSHIAFLSDCAKADQFQLYVAPAAGGAAKQESHLTGLLADPKWAPDGKRIAILFTQNLPHRAGPLDPVPPDSGVLDSKIYEQRIAAIDLAAGTMRQLSPANMYIYEYDWSPDSRTFAVSAAQGMGDNNWWIAQIYTLASAGGELKSVYKPPVERQVAEPRWTPDGKSILFIGGIMSDEGSTGGEIYKVDASGGAAVSVTPGIKSSVADIVAPKKSKYIYFSEHYDGGSAVSQVDLATGQTERLWNGDETIFTMDGGGVSLSDDGKSTVVTRNSWQRPPEVWTGSIGNWRKLTHANDAALPMWGDQKSLHWKSDEFNVQGWLIYPKNFDASRKYPMVVSVHGGPASSMKPTWPKPGFNATLLSQQGYFVLLPNPRGSYGQGEKFTAANVKDFGGGDLRDILAGVDEAIKSAPIDENRVGITGWSYGGYMTMWAVTQTDRFHAAVAGAGIANWQSYYGENSIDQWMLPYFGASVYDDAKVYAKSAPIEFIKNVKTPTLVVVGDRDGECPAPQSYEFWHALRDRGVKTQMVIYPNEGHRFHKPADQRDVLVRMIGWFNENLK